MKKVLIAVAIFLGTNCNAQLGVYTLQPKQDVYYDVWYTIDEKEEKHHVRYLTKIDKVDAQLTKLLEPYGLYLSDSQLDDAGDQYWVVDTENGFTAYVYRIELDAEDVEIQILLEINK